MRLYAVNRKKGKQTAKSKVKIREFYAGIRLLLKRKHLFFLHFFTNYCESQRTHMIIFCGSQAQISAKKKRDSLRKFHRTYGLPLENYLSDGANHYRKCTTVRRPLGNTVIYQIQHFEADFLWCQFKGSKQYFLETYNIL